MRSLFCMASNDISGGNKVFRHWMNLLAQDGQEVHRFIWDKRRQFAGWNDITVIDQESVDDVATIDFDFVFFSNSFLVPMILPHIGKAYPVLMAMAYESFHYGKTYAEAMTDKTAFLKILNLPISIMAVSKGVERLLKERAGVDSYYVPHGIESHFFARPTPDFAQVPKRILMVGSYLSPWKGMRSGFDAIEKLSKEMDVQLVLITQPTISRNIFEQYSFPIEFHCRPDLSEIPNIYSSCHVHLCCSWHEGTGMPTLECMKCAVPVIATSNDGIDEFAKDGTNILVADKNSTDDLYEKLKSLLSDESQYESLKTNGPDAMEFYTWENCFQLFKAALEDISKQPVTSSFDSATMNELVQELEREGLFTPLETYATLNNVDRDVKSICERLIQSTISAEDAVVALKQIRNQAKPFIQNENSESYSSFRGVYDFCGVLLALEGDKNFLKYAVAISKKKIAVTA